MEKNKLYGCSYCNPNIPNEHFIKGWEDGALKREIALASGGWTTLFLGFDRHGRVGMVGEGDGETDIYYPKYCPECGRKLEVSENDIS